MNGTNLVGYGLIVGIAAFSPGCAGVRSALPASTTPTSFGAAAKSGSLLYVINRRPNALVEVVTFPEGKDVGTLPNYGYATGVCSDASGNVWVPYFKNEHVMVAEFAHGGKRPIAKLTTPLRGANGCAVDSKTGNLAVLSTAGINGSGGEILVWKNAKGKPIAHQTAFEAEAAGYDDHGNLFVDGVIGSGFSFGELAQGASQVHYVKIEHAEVSLGSVQWDGTYVAVAGAEQRRHPIFRLQVSHFVAHVVETVQLRGVPYQAYFWTNGSTVVATERNTRHLGIWSYPTGGAPSAMLTGFHDAGSLAMSPAR
jgi:hypothetical protein